MELLGTYGQAKHRAELNDFSVEFDETHAGEAMESLIKKAGGWAPSLKCYPIDDAVYDEPIQTAAMVAEALQPPDDDATDTKIARAIRTARLEQDERAAKAAGFAVKDPIYALGRRVNEWGVENAQKSRLEFDAKPLVATACCEFEDKITAEKRRDTTVEARNIIMAADGFVVTRTADGLSKRVNITEPAFDSLCARTPMGGAGYLKNCRPSLRAYNVNEWMGQIGRDEDAAIDDWKRAPEKDRGREPKRTELVVRARSTADQRRQIFAIVSKQYEAFDCDRIARVVRSLVPADARGSIVYDGQRTRIEALFHSDVASTDYGAGEIFRAGVIVTTDDTGNGSIRVSSVVERNLCLNLIILDTVTQNIAAIRHIGDYVATRVKAAVADALESLQYFQKSWGYARADELLLDTSAAAGEDLSDLSARSLLAGILWAQTKQELVPVLGRKPEAVRAALKAYDREPVKTERLNRADVVNVWTRYAHEDAALKSPWIEDEIQTAAGKLLASKRPMPYELPTFEL